MLFGLYQPIVLLSGELIDALVGLLQIISAVFLIGKDDAGAAALVLKNDLNGMRCVVNWSDPCVLYEYAPQGQSLTELARWDKADLVGLALP